MTGTTYPGQPYPGQTAPPGAVSGSVYAEPRFILEVAFATDPFSTPVWTDISWYLSEFQVRRGRQRELDRIDAGQLTFKLEYKYREFDPTHTGSPYSPFVLPMRRVRLRAEWDGIIYPQFSGFVDSWPQTLEGPMLGTSTVSATDAFLPLSKIDIGVGEPWPREFSGSRINRILDEVNWPGPDRAIDSGFSEIDETTFSLGSGVTALGHLQEVADAEMGVFFLDGSGKAVFHDRHHRRRAAYLASQATFSDSAVDGLPYSNVVLDTNSDRIWNDVQVVSPGATVQRAQDTASQTTYLRRTLARSVPLARETEAADQSAYLLSLYKDPHYRFSAIQIDPTTNAEYVQALGREVSDHITVKRWPQGVGSQITQQCSIESLEQRGTHGRLQTSWLLSTPAYTAVDWWLLGDSTSGVEGTTTKLVY